MAAATKKKTRGAKKKIRRRWLPLGVAVSTFSAVVCLYIEVPPRLISLSTTTTTKADGNLTVVPSGDDNQQELVDSVDNSSSEDESLLWLSTTMRRTILSDDEELCNPIIIPPGDKKQLEELVEAVVVNISAPEEEENCPITSKRRYIKLLLGHRARELYLSSRTTTTNATTMMRRHSNEWKHTLLQEARKLCTNHRIPTEEQVQAKFGIKPVIVGMDTCSSGRIHPRVAGMYHTGTNALANSFQVNIQSEPCFKGFYNPYEVMWGKHLPPDGWRLTNRVYTGDNTRDALTPSEILPVVIIRDPFDWMQSMCKKGYSAKWKFPERDERCPAVVVLERNGQGVDSKELYKVRMNQRPAKLTYNSLPEMWIKFHLQYLNADFPRLIVRYEDLLYRHDEVLRAILHCAGLTEPDPIEHLGEPAKTHGKPESVLTALTKYILPYNQTQQRRRHQGLTLEDREYTNEQLRQSGLMETFGYDLAPLHVYADELQPPYANSETAGPLQIGESIIKEKMRLSKEGRAMMIRQGGRHSRYWMQRQGRNDLR